MALLVINKLRDKGEKSLNVVKQTTQKATGWASMMVSSASSNMAETTQNAKKGVCEFAVNTIMNLIKGINLDGLIENVLKFGQDKKRDVSATVGFLNKLKNLQEDGE